MTAVIGGLFLGLRREHGDFRDTRPLLAFKLKSEN